MKKGIIVHSFIMHRGRVLILKRSEEEDRFPGYWDFPGGTLKDGELPIAGAKRENREETGLVLTGLRLFYCVSNFDRPKNTQFITLIFLAETKTQPTSIKLCSREHTEFRWIKFDELENFRVVDYVRQCVAFLKGHSYLIGRRRKKHPPHPSHR